MGEGEGPSFYTTLSETPRQQVRKEWGTGRLTLRLPAEQKDEAVAAGGWPQQQVCAVRAVGSGAEDLQSTLHFISFHFALLF